MGVVITEGEGAVLGMNLGHPIVTSGDDNELFPNYFGGMTCYHYTAMYMCFPVSNMIVYPGSLLEIVWTHRFYCCEWRLSLQFFCDLQTLPDWK